MLWLFNLIVRKAAVPFLVHGDIWEYFHICWPVRAWAQAAPRHTPPRRIPNRRPRWSASGSRTPASSSFSPAARARSAPHALHAHTYSAHRSSCGRRKNTKKGIHEDMATQRVLGPCNTDLCVAQQKLWFVEVQEANAAVIMWMYCN